MAELKPHSVMIAVPHGGVVEWAFHESIVAALLYDSEHGRVICDGRGAEGLYVPDNRDRLCRFFMRSNAEWLWFIDTDISFAPDTLEKLLQCADPVERPIMSALYFGYMHFNNEIVPVWYGRTEDGRIENLRNFHSGVQRLGVVGMGCCIIHRSVFEKFGGRWAKTGWLYFGRDTAPWVPDAAIDNDLTPFGEDNCFCARCDELGIPIHGNADIVVQHRKKRYEDMETFLASFGQSEVKADAHGTLVRLRREQSKENFSTERRSVVFADDARFKPGASAGRAVGSNGSPFTVPE